MECPSNDKFIPMSPEEVKDDKVVKVGIGGGRDQHLKENFEQRRRVREEESKS